MARNTHVQADRNAPAITHMLADFVVNHPSAGWSPEVEHEAVRTFLNWMGCAIGASTHEVTEVALHAMQAFEPAEQASILGRPEKVDMRSAALLNGISSHTFDFDDTHLKTIIHPAGPVCSAALALAEKKGSSGRELIDAIVLGIDVACRVGNMLYPDHYDRGWHITGSTGGLGAAAACARLLGLNVHQTTMALGIAASQPVGLREQFGTMTKPFHPGGAAQVGLTAAILAQNGFTSSPRALEAPRGFAQVISEKTTWSEISDELGERFEISFNSYKPFACGIVIHPSIDASIQLREKGVTAENLSRLDLRVHPLVLELTGKKTPQDGLQGKFSVYHGCAVGLVYGQAAETEYTDELVTSAAMADLRAKVHATVDPSIAEASVDATATLHDGRQIRVFVEHAVGSLERPMSDQALEDKFHLLGDPLLGRERIDMLLAQCWRLAALNDVKSLTALAR